MASTPGTEPEESREGQRVTGPESTKCWGGGWALEEMTVTLSLIKYRYQLPTRDHLNSGVTEPLNHSSCARSKSHLGGPVPPLGHLPTITPSPCFSDDMRAQRWDWMELAAGYMRGLGHPSPPAARGETTHGLLPETQRGPRLQTKLKHRLCVVETAWRADELPSPM